MEKKLFYLFCSLFTVALLFSLSFLPPQEINSQEELQTLIDHQKVKAQGTILKHKVRSSLLLLTLENNITIITSPSPFLLQGKNITIEGIKESYQRQAQIKATRITLHQ
ncbi:MAG: hypothetical protein AABY00_00110 [Nanoarchaeota archaeon]